MPTASYSIRRQLTSYDSGATSFGGAYLLCAKSGALRLETGDRLWLLPPERAAWIPPGVVVRIVAEGATETASVAFSDRAAPQPGAQCVVVHLSPLAREMVLHSTRWSSPDQGTEDTERFYHCLADVCLELLDRPINLWLPRASSRTLERATDHILGHLGTRLSPSDVADAVHTTPRTLARYFRSELHLSLGQYVQRARVLRATELLAQPDLTVLELAWSLGLSSVGSFEAAFRAHVGVTPTQYRRGLAPRG